MSEPREKSRVSQAVLDGLEAARSDGRYNMFQIKSVIDLMWMLGYPEAAEWAESHKKEYTAGIFAGFVAEESEPVEVQPYAHDPYTPF